MKPGTSGLRKKVSPSSPSPHYLANFVQSVLDAVRPAQRLLPAARSLSAAMAATTTCEAHATGHQDRGGERLRRVMVGQGGILSTPAASCVIRKHQALRRADPQSASHNEGGADGDFGIKFNAANGGPAPERITDAIYRTQPAISEYLIADAPDIDLERIGSQQVDRMRV